MPLLDESHFELMGDIVVNSKVELEPFDLEFLEKISVQFGRKHKVDDFENYIGEEEQVHSCSKMQDDEILHPRYRKTLKLPKKNFRILEAY